ncbi:MAG: hypothetical protein H3C68_00875 [Deltaproteobacteria bacterium]|nr:hypothetical protein [Deltaproteobacteria bacterium]MBZ0219194.1 hypothetical protein [Deltaproteobacteria bacterium]
MRVIASKKFIVGAIITVFFVSLLREAIAWKYGPSFEVNTNTAQPLKSEPVKLIPLVPVNYFSEGEGPVKESISHPFASEQFGSPNLADNVALVGTVTTSSGQSYIVFESQKFNEQRSFTVGENVFGLGILKQIGDGTAHIEAKGKMLAISILDSRPPDTPNNKVSNNAPIEKPACTESVYLLVQSLSTYNTSSFGAISTVEEAERIFEEIKDRVHGLEFETLYYNDEDLKVHHKIAETAKRYGIELWATSWRLRDRIRSFGKIPVEYQAYRMLPDGTIILAEVDGKPLFDVLNGEAMAWFLKEYREKYLEPFKGLLSGYFFNEDVLAYFGERKGNNNRYDYWNNPTFSPAVLKAWREYCKANMIIHDGKIVNSFPVHTPEMAANGGGLTEYFPGYNVPEVIYPGQSFSQLPKAEGVWKHWDDFVTERFQSIWIDQIAELANKVNEDSSTEWRGVKYFGLHHWSLPFEIIKDKNFTVPEIHRWGAWGRQRGVDLEKMSASPHIKTVVCETYPPIKANLEFYIREFKRESERNDKSFGVMLHRDDNWQLDIEEEAKRWNLINTYRPSVLVRFPLKNMLPWNANYSSYRESLFDYNLKAYKENYCSSPINPLQ